MDKGKLFLIAVLAALLTSGVVSGLTFYFMQHGKSKSAYVETTVVFTKFKGRLKVQEKLQNEQNRQKLMMDSLQLQFESLKRVYSNGGASREKVAREMQDLEVRYNYLGTEFQKVNEKESQKAMDEIWTQLNQHIKDYGKLNGYSYIYGASGDGSLMYADESNNITNAVVEFANKKYAGK